MNISTIDLHFLHTPSVIACYLIQKNNQTVLIETGPSSTRDVLLHQLHLHKLTVSDIDAIFITHVHLDHAGSAGWWANRGIPVYVHERGAKHIINPSRLMESATMVYGNRMDELWGEMEHCSAENVISVTDNQVIQIGNLSVTALDTPGHARHHHTFLIDDVAFTGDVTGIRLPNQSYISVAAAPPQFDPIAYDQSLLRLLDLNVRAIYPTHFGGYTNVRSHIERYRVAVQESAEFIRSQLQAGIEGTSLQDAYLLYNVKRMRAEGMTDDMIQQYEGANPSGISAEGIALYWKKYGKN